jgi:hypothetical protein
MRRILPSSVGLFLLYTPLKPEQAKLASPEI